MSERQTGANEIGRLGDALVPSGPDGGHFVTRNVRWGRSVLSKVLVDSHFTVVPVSFVSVFFLMAEKNISKTHQVFIADGVHFRHNQGLSGGRLNHEEHTWVLY